MNQTEVIRRYLANRREVDVQPTGLPFITISRQTGAGGHELSREILKTLAASPDPELNQGWELFDQKLCALLVQDPALHASFESLLAEEYRDDFHQTFVDMFTGRTDQYTLYKRIAEVIRLLATLGKAIIVGRGGMCVTRGMTQGVHLRVVAPEDVRLRNAMQAFSLPEKEALELMHRQERDRENMVRDFHHVHINDPLLYDAVWNTGVVPLPEIAAVIVELIKHRLKAR